MCKARSRYDGLEPGSANTPLITAALLAQQNPIVARRWFRPILATPVQPGPQMLTTSVTTPGSWKPSEASAVLLWANGLFNHHDPTPNEMTHLEGSDLWTLTWRLPASWRASYRISIWSPPQSGGDTPPWRAPGDRFAARRAAMAGELSNTSLPAYLVQRLRIALYGQLLTVFFSSFIPFNFWYEYYYRHYNNQNDSR